MKKVVCILSHQLILQSCANCFSLGSVQVPLRKPIATCDFPRGSGPQVPPLDPRMFLCFSLCKDVSGMALIV